MFARRPSANELAAFGLSWADVAGDYCVDIYPCNERSFRVFDSIKTQWRVGQVGVYGLDYNVLPLLLKVNSIPESDWPQVMTDIRIMEAAAIDQIRENQS